ncbi:PAS domain S-box protein [Chromobacterium paludis]|uniref:PAS domain S-box protein n=1 Tax=Chromobacterium paludis TaxID=2605945 RepID=A0A5C1DGK8_9NEIS|nr:PAS domain S-box protein [Chromobacterium paludis]
MRIKPRTRYILLATAGYGIFAWAWLAFAGDGIRMLGGSNPSMLNEGLFALCSVLLLSLGWRAAPTEDGASAAQRPAALAADLLPRQGAVGLAYALACVLTAAIVALRVALVSDAGAQPSLILFTLPIVLCASLGGFGPGLLATLLALLAADFSPAWPWHATLRWSSPLQQALLLGEGLAISGFGAMLRRSLSRAELNHRLLDSVVSSTSDAVFIKDVQGRYLLINQAGLAFVGKARADLLGRDDLAAFDEATARKLIASDRAAMQSGRVQTYEECLTLQSGERMVFQVTKGPVYTPDHRLIGLFGISRDITEQKRAAEALQASEAELQLAQQLASLGSWSWDLASNRVHWSNETYRLFGLASQDAPPAYAAWQRYFTLDGWMQLSDAMERCRLIGLGYECDLELLRQDGTSCWVTVHVEARRDEEGKVAGLYGTIQDITERTQMALLIQESEQRLQLVVEATSDGFWDWDLRSGRIYRSPRFYEVTGAHPEENDGDFRFFRQLVHAADLPFVLQALEAHRRGKTPRIEVEFRLADQTSGVRWLQVRGRAVEWDERGAALRLVGNLSDITERKRVDDDLRLVLNEAGDAIWVIDAEGGFVFANPAACQLTGHSMEELKTMRLRDLLAGECLSALPGHLAALDAGAFQRSEWLLRRKKGGNVSVDLSTGKLKDGRYMAFGRDLTEQRRAEQALRQREQQLARVIEGSDQGYWDWNLKTGSFQVSPRWEGMLGYEPGQMRITGENWYSHVHPEDAERARESIRRNLSGEAASHEVEIRCRTRGGDWRWILSRGRVVERDETGAPMMMAGTHTDITERKVFEQAQKEAAAVFASSYEGILMVSPDGFITKVNQAFTRITGYSAEDVVGRKPSILSSGQQPESFYEELWRSLHGHDFWRGELWNRRKNGELYAELLSISVVRDEHGEVQHYIGIFSDITQLKQHEAELDRVAHFDPLTGVPNRRLLSDRLRQAIVRASRSGKSCAVCFLDLDGFKTVNDQYGHEMGDQLLIGVSSHLKSVLRGGDTLARLGGDEFVVLLSDIEAADECVLVLDRILEAVAQPVAIGSAAISVTASVGVSLYPQDNADPDTLLRHADQAMYVAKESGKNRYQLFDPESDRKAQEHRQFLELLRQALERNEFALFYQPMVDLVDGEIMGMEALIRWRHPQRGLLAPAEFLPHLRGHELESAFGDWVLDAALKQASKWAEAGHPLRISTNVSPSYLHGGDFCAKLAAALSHYPNVAPDHVELEVQESAQADVEKTIATLQQCRGLGVRFALDDFGTGYASLNYLRRLPVDTLKIDNSFVHGMLVSIDDRRTVEGVIQLAGIFERRAVAEGVETLPHAALLRRLGCRYAQGYGIARPMEAEAVSGWCRRWSQGAIWRQLDAAAEPDGQM